MIKRYLFLIVFFAFASVANSQSIAKWKIEDVVKSYTKNNDTVYVVNFWATFCKPCIAEIPDFIRIVKQYEKQKVKLVLVSLDLPAYYPAKIAAFVKKNNYTAKIAWLNETNADHFCPMIDKSWSGSIPSTIVVNNKTGYRKFTEGEMNAAEFEGLIKEAIGGNAFHKYVAPMNEAIVIDNKSIRGICDATPMDNITFKSDDSSVYAITEGKVVTVARIEDMKIIIVKNENLFYTYSNLVTTAFKKGDKVKAGQLIGYAALDLDGYKPTVDMYVSNSEKNIVLTKENFITRKK